MAKRLREDYVEIDSDSVDESDSAASVGNTNQDPLRIRKYTRAAKYKTRYNPIWAKTYPVKALPNDRLSCYCIPMERKFGAVTWVRDVMIHCERDSHKRNVATAKKNNISQFFSKSTDSISKKVIKAEVMVTNFLVQHDLPLATADHLGLLFKDIFTDSKIAESYMSGCTKTTAMLNLSMAPHCHSYLVDHCQSHPYSLGIDHLMVQTTLDCRK